jgi:hypothetical protein
MVLGVGAGRICMFPTTRPAMNGFESLNFFYFFKKSKIHQMSFIPCIFSLRFFVKQIKAFFI